MANNRLWVFCTVCQPVWDAEHVLDVAQVALLAKYYPSTGWFAPTGRDKRLQHFFDQHEDCGEHSFVMQYEQPTD